MTRPDFIVSSGFASVCTHCGTHRKAAPIAQRRQRGRALLRDVLLAILIGTALAAVLFIGLSGGFRHHA
jgi:hypothetical protein